MKERGNYRRLVPLTGLALALILVPTLAVAQPGFHRGPKPFGGGPGHHGDGPLAQLDLTSQQRDDIHDLLVGQRDQMRASGEAMREARQALRNAVHAEVYDENAIRNAVAKVAAAEEQMALQRAATFQEINKILTPEQQVEARKLMEKREEFFNERRGEGPPRFGGGRSRR